MFTRVRFKRQHCNVADSKRSYKLTYPLRALEDALGNETVNTTYSKFGYFG